MSAHTYIHTYFLERSDIVKVKMLPINLTCANLVLTQQTKKEHLFPGPHQASHHSQKPGLGPRNKACTYTTDRMYQSQISQTLHVVDSGVVDIAVARAQHGHTMFVLTSTQSAETYRGV